MEKAARRGGGGKSPTRQPPNDSNCRQELNSHPVLGRGSPAYGWSPLQIPRCALPGGLVPTLKNLESTSRGRGLNTPWDLLGQEGAEPLPNGAPNLATQPRRTLGLRSKTQKLQRSRKKDGGWLRPPLSGQPEAQTTEFHAKLISVLWARETRGVLSPLWRFDLHS